MSRALVELGHPRHPVGIYLTMVKGYDNRLASECHRVWRSPWEAPNPVQLEVLSLLLPLTWAPQNWGPGAGSITRVQAIPAPSQNPCVTFTQCPGPRSGGSSWAAPGPKEEKVPSLNSVTPAAPTTLAPTPASTSGQRLLQTTSSCGGHSQKAALA